MSRTFVRIAAVFLLAAGVINTPAAVAETPDETSDGSSSSGRCRPMAASPEVVPVVSIRFSGLEGKTALAWAFQKGKSFFLEISSETIQAMKVAGQNVNQTQGQTMVIKWTPRHQDKDKNWVVAHRIEAVRTAIDIGGSRLTYDSAKANEGNNPLADVFKAMVGAELESTIAPNMKILRVKGFEDVRKKLLKGAPQFEGMLGEDAFKQMLASGLVPLPGKSVKKGKPWVIQSVMDLGPLGGYQSTVRYTYQGREGRFDKVKVETTSMKYQPPVAQGKLPFTIKKANFEGKSASGLILFDRVGKQLQSSDVVLKMEGKMTITIGGMDTEVELSQTQRTRVKVMDRLPAKK